MKTFIFYAVAAVVSTGSFPTLSRASLWSSFRDTVFSLTTRQSSSNDTQAPVGSRLWVVQDTYQGATFFDEWDFWSEADPTHGTVDYVTREDAFAKGLAYITPDGQAVMKSDDTSWLPLGQQRQSVRIESRKRYNGGLFILDVSKSPYGCGIWPAAWSYGDNWPLNGEIDIIEGVHDNVHNQVAFHTAQGCTLASPGNFTGTVHHTDCYAYVNDNAGCGVVDLSRSSYGESFNALGGGVYAMKWDEEGISVWYFYRATIPRDIVQGLPNPTVEAWGIPSAHLAPQTCDPFQFFKDHKFVFDITFCGDWAGTSYPNSGCPGTCDDQMMDPNNFKNAIWSVNHLKVYRKTTLLPGRLRNSSPEGRYSPSSVYFLAMFVSLLTALLLIDVRWDVLFQ